ncbi:ATP-grasp domain-containing protein [Methanolobus chelungpuianus]|uniref:ATP-dependent carboligase n=1 Tax=Methanolobus chelungpuianus TaxID=502115 RepID=A0AAE3HC68_9EURY|nr:ATP-grasp domain-containing protein [Methanolobus chelungpuianus]MCQ6963118.1 ATP-dependent carboligase [Methanolobus chelungpuianus]
MKNVLVIGFSTRNAICSGCRAGYNMYAIDAFCDQDMLRCAADARRLVPEGRFDSKLIDPSVLMEAIESFGVDFDAIIPASGFETLELPGSRYPVLQNNLAALEKVTDKSRFAELLGSMDMPHPQTYSYSELDSASFPLMVKPACAGGGIFNRVVHSQEELDNYILRLQSDQMHLEIDDMVFQQYMSGMPASVSLISTPDRACTLAVNEQLIGVPWLTRLPFAYCGNVTPLLTPYANQMKNIAEELITEFGLIGSSGVDFLITDDGPVPLEVNARFQGSMDTVELATGANIFEEHMQAFEGHILQERLTEPVYRQYAARAVMYAEQRTRITEQAMDAIDRKQTADIPRTGDIIGENEPVTSVISTGHTRKNVMGEIEQSVMFIRQRLNVE